MLMLGCAARSSSHADPMRGGYDFRFITEMSDHLMHDLRTTKACKGKNIRSELSSFCRELEAVQSREQEQLGKMLKEWYGKEQHRDPFPLWLESQDGIIFEKHFLAAVLKDHEVMARKANECVKKAEHAELASLCGTMSTNRKAEADKMKAWNCAWFKECD